MNWMALIRTLTLSITAFERKKEEIWYQDKKKQKKAPGQKPPEQILYDKTFLPWISLLLVSSLIKTKFPRIVFIEKAFLYYS